MLNQEGEPIKMESTNKDMVKIDLTGRIDSTNSADIEQEINKKLEGHDKAGVILDAEDLEYISSAGLRVILRTKKSHPDLSVINVNPEVYEIFDMTGFTQMFTVEKAYRVVSVEGCEVIGEGANGKVYRLDRDTVVKTYKNADALAEIQNEREVARLALILGIPTAISYDVVKVGDSYGSVFELLDSRSFAGILANEPEKLDWCVDEYAELLRKIHSTEVPKGKLSSQKKVAQRWAEGVKPYFDEDKAKKIKDLVDAIPETDTMIHGDCHTKNIVLSGDEVLLIDMDTLAVGHPILELAQMYVSYIGFAEYDHEVIRRFQGYSFEIAEEFWKKTLKAYLGTDDDKKVEDAENKIRLLAYVRLIDWSRRHKADGTDEDIATRELWIRELNELLDQIDTLEF